MVSSILNTKTLPRNVRVCVCVCESVCDCVCECVCDCVSPVPVSLHSAMGACVNDSVCVRAYSDRTSVCMSPRACVTVCVSV